MELKLNDPEGLVKWMTSKKVDEELNDKFKQTWNMVSFVDDLIREHPKQRDVINAILTKYPDISENTAYRYFRFSQQVIGSTNKRDRDYEVYYLQETVKEAMEYARAKKSAKDLLAAVKQLREVWGHDKDEGDFSAEDIMPHTFIIDFDPAILNLKRFKNLDNIIKNLDPQKSISEQIAAGVVDVEYEDVKDDGGE